MQKAVAAVPASEIQVPTGRDLFLGIGLMTQVGTRRKGVGNLVTTSWPVDRNVMERSARQEWTFQTPILKGVCPLSIRYPAFVFVAPSLLSGCAASCSCMRKKPHFMKIPYLRRPAYIPNTPRKDPTESFLFLKAQLAGREEEDDFASPQNILCF